MLKETLPVELPTGLLVLMHMRNTQNWCDLTRIGYFPDCMHYEIYGYSTLFLFGVYRHCEEYELYTAWQSHSHIALHSAAEISVTGGPGLGTMKAAILGYWTAISAI